MYKLNNIALSDFGFIPGQLPGSNLALNGFLDVPERLGKTYHSWGDFNGIEPYVHAEQLRFGGRDLMLKGYIENRDLLADFYDFVNTLNLATLSCPWGSFEVYVSEQIQATALGSDYVELLIPFREPVVPLSVNNVEKSADTQHIDGYSFTDLNAIITAVKLRLNRPAPKAMQYTAYTNEGYQITKTEAQTLELHLVVYASSFEAVKASVNALRAILQAPGLRTLKLDDKTRQCYATKGFKVSNIRVMDGLSVCELNVELTMTDFIYDLNLPYLQDNFGIAIVTKTNEYIITG